MKQPWNRLEFFADRDYCWHLFERAMARAERFRLIDEGRIVPFSRLQPTLMVRNNQPDDRHVFGNGKGWSIEMKVIDGETTE